MSEIATNRISLAERSTSLKHASDGFDNQAFNPVDDKSTITANQNANIAFDDITQGHNSYSNALAASSKQIMEIGDDFITVDRHSARNLIEHITE